MTLQIIRQLSVCFFFLFITPQLISAQEVTEIDILRSGDYYWGKGYGEDRDEALNNAKRELIQKMVTTIVAESSLNVEETEEEYSSQFKSNTTSFSRVQIRDLEYLPPEKRRNDTWEAIAYVTKESFNSSMKEEEAKLLSMLSQALSNEKQGKLNQAIPQLFDIYASTFFYPAPFFTDADKHGREVELRSFVRNRIIGWVNNTELNVKKVRSLSTSSNTEIYIDFEVNYDGAKTDNFNISLDKLGYAKRPVINGKASVFIDLAPENPLKTYSFLLEPTIPSRIEEEKREFLEQLLSERKVSVQIDFSNVMEIDFSVVKEDENTFIFSPQIQNVSVFDIEWDFNDGRTSTQTKPKHSFTNIKAGQKVTLIVNQEEKLSVTKTITPEGKTSDTEPVTDKREENIEKDNSKSKAPSIPFSHRSHINEMIRMKSGANLGNYLNSIAKNKVIQLGNRSDVNNPDKSYIAIIDPTTRTVEAILTPVSNDNRYNLTTESFIKNSELSDEFRGFGSIWFQFN